MALARRYPDIVFSVAVGNEATVDWTDHYVPVPRMIELRAAGQGAVRQPVTFCENYVPWQHKLRDLVAELDFISLHTYPVWEYKHIHEALDYTGQRTTAWRGSIRTSRSSSPRPAGALPATAAACMPSMRCRSCRPSTTRT
jgi:hypothetical protein